MPVFQLLADILRINPGHQSITINHNILDLIIAPKQNLCLIVKQKMLKNYFGRKIAAICHLKDLNN